MADGTNIGLVASVVGTVIALIAIWDRLTDRIAKASEKAELATEKAETAQQEAAEAKNEMDSIREILDEMKRDHHEQMERMRREDGDSLTAIRQHVTEMGFFMRDNFVRNDIFVAAMLKIEAGQLRTEGKLDRLSEQMREA